MNEDQARAWIASRFGDPASHQIARFLEYVIAENRTQNLIAPASVADIWVRHAFDSAQLLLLAPDRWSTWLDIGTGGGFPGMIVALLAPERQVIMVEPRRKRAEFLARGAQAFGLANATVASTKVEQVTALADVISARAVASVENLLRAAGHCAKAETVWLLPRGRSGADLADLSPRDRSMFHVEHSLTDPASTILVMTEGAR